MANHSENMNISFYKKWWFWLIILIIVVLISFTLIMWKAFSTAFDEVYLLAIDVQNVYEDATIYTSAGDNSIIIELRNYSNDNAEELSEIITIVKDRINNGELQQYSQLITLTYLESNDIQEALFIKDVYNIPEFTLKEDTKEYIIFDEYEDLIDSFSSIY